MPRRFALLLALALVAVILAGCTSETATSDPGDKDGDGLPDEAELAGWNVTVTGLSGLNTTIHVTSDPAKKDTDGDGLTDYQEWVKETNPRDPDSDGDGLLDGKSSTNPDLAGKGLVEDPPGTFLGEASLCLEVNGLDPLKADSDKPLPDGIPDGDEIRGWAITVRGETRFVQSSPCRPDTDQDGLTDAGERELGTDPARRDTDGDGVLDLVDADPLWDVGFRVEGVSFRSKSGTLPDDARLLVLVEGDQRAFPLTEGDLDFEYEVDVDDSGDGEGAFPKTIVVRADANGSSLDLGGGNGPVGVEHDALSGDDTVTVEGPDGTLLLSIALTRR